LIRTSKTVWDQVEGIINQHYKNSKRIIWIKVNWAKEFQESHLMETQSHQTRKHEMWPTWGNQAIPKSWQQTRRITTPPTTTRLLRPLMPRQCIYIITIWTSYKSSIRILRQSRKTRPIWRRYRTVKKNCRCWDKKRNINRWQADKRQLWEEVSLLRKARSENKHTTRNRV